MVIDKKYINPFILATERAAYGASLYKGKGDKIAADQSAVDEMRNQFYTISEGEYSKLLFDLFGRERVEYELEQFLSFDFFPRFGGGIGVTRMISAMKRAGLIVND